MRIVYYKTASCNPNMVNSLPDDFITEWTYQDAQPDTFDATGWEQLPEDDFLVLLDQNQSKLDAFLS